MPYVIRCPHCKRQLQLADDSAGKLFRCPFCQNTFAAPLPAAPTPTPEAKTCPACGSKLLEGMVSCMDCGYLLQPDASLGADTEWPVLCPNPACGVANPTSNRFCQRCTTPLPTPPGTILHDRYRIKKLLAMGGFGAVYRAEDTKEHNREVAVKDMVCTDRQEYAIRLSFFRREAEMLLMLANVPLVPRFYDLIVTEQVAHLIMEYLRGRDLLSLLLDNDNRTFPVGLVIEWGKQICDLLTTLHTQNPPLIHRNISPDSFMLLEDGRSIRVIDFSVARPIDVRERRSHWYPSGYAPPEHIVGKPEPRSDLFALAGTLYHLATGKAPEGSYTIPEIEARLADGSIPVDQRWFFELIKINLAEDAHDRYATAAEIKIDLERRQVTREVKCLECGQINPARHPYCRACCAPLTALSPRECASCGGRNVMGSRLCVHCGKRVW